MTSLFAPSYSLTLGSQIWTQQVKRLNLTQALAPQVNLLQAWFPVAAPFAGSIGDDAELTLSSGEREELVFTGEIDAIRHGVDEIRVTCVDAGGLLARFRPAVTFEQATASTIIRDLAKEIAADLGDLEEGPTLRFYVADPARTAWEHIARLSAWGGAVAGVRADNTVTSVVIDASQAEFALRFGREILSLQASRLSSSVDSFTIAGEAGAGDASAPEATRATTDFFAGHRPDGPGLKHRWRYEPALRTIKAAGTAGASLQRQYASGREAGSFQAFLQPHLRCGTVLEVQDLPDGLPGGPLWIGYLEHRLGPGGASTTARFQRGGDKFDPAALLGSLADLAGGLF